MKIRVMGTRDEIDTVLPVLSAVLVVQEVSGFYPNHASRLGRVYLDVTGPAPGVVHVRADRADRTDRPIPPAIEPPHRGEIQ